MVSKHDPAYVVNFGLILGLPRDGIRSGGIAVAVGCAGTGGIDSWVVLGSIEVEACVQVKLGGTFTPTSELDGWVGGVD